MLEKFLHSDKYFSTQCRLTLFLSICICSTIGCAPITADLPWFVCCKLCTNYGRSSLVCFLTILSFTCRMSRRAVICFLSAGTIGNRLEACSSAMADNFLSNQVVSIDTKTFEHQQRLGYSFPFFVADPLGCSLALPLFTACTYSHIGRAIFRLHSPRHRISGFVRQLCCC